MKGTDLSIRRASQKDYAPTRQLVEDAFAPEDVGTFLDALRNDGCILQEWLAEDSSGLVGHIVFSRVRVTWPHDTRMNAAMLTPLAVRRDRQRTGIGTRLMHHALDELEARGETLFFVLGHPEYYPRFGFRAARAAELASKWPNDCAFMVRGALVSGGTLEMPSVIAEAH